MLRRCCVSSGGCNAAGALLHHAQFVGESLENVCETLHAALYVAQHIPERETRLRRDWCVEIACPGECLGSAPVVRVEVQAACTNGPLEGRAWAATTPRAFRNGELGHTRAAVVQCLWPLASPAWGHNCRRGSRSPSGRVGGETLTLLLCPS
jgi:hypothetical protein